MMSKKYVDAFSAFRIIIQPFVLFEKICACKKLLALNQSLYHYFEIAFLSTLIYAIYRGIFNLNVPIFSSYGMGHSSLKGGSGIKKSCLIFDNNL